MAHDESRKAAWLAVECAGQGILFGLADAGEIFSVGAMRPVPRTQPWFLGVTNLRGALHGVVDLAVFLGLRAEHAAEAQREQSPLVALAPSLGIQCAVLVDRLAGLRRVEQLSAVPVIAPDAGAAPGARPDFAGPQWQDEQGRMWQEIHLPALARSEHFLGIAA